MTTDRLLHGDTADELRALPGYVLRARLTEAEWRAAAEALSALVTTLRAGSDREVLRAVGVFDDLGGVRVGSEPGGLAVEGPSDEITHLVHEVELAVSERLSDTFRGRTAD